jgi:hypothetical protein
MKSCAELTNITPAASCQLDVKRPSRTVASPADRSEVTCMSCRLYGQVGCFRPADDLVGELLILQL